MVRDLPLQMSSIVILSLVLSCEATEDPPQVQEPPCTIETATTAGGVEVFKYEASLPDASQEDAGDRLASDTACSRAGVLPMGNVSFQEATDRCRAAGFDLCTYNMWLAGCGGQAGQPYPYGWQEQMHRCNDFIAGENRLLTTGEFSGCVSPDGLHDMVGNLWEWIILEEEDPSTGQSTTKKAYIGGSYRVTSMSRSIHPTNCDSLITPIQTYEDMMMEDLGFRCCR